MLPFFKKNKIMKKIKQIIAIAFDSLVDGLFLIRLSLHLKESNNNKEWHDKEVKLLLQFFAMAFDKSAFEFYNLNNEEYMYYYYSSLKNKNSGIFQSFCFIYCLIICHTINPILHSILLPKHLKYVYKFEEKEQNFFDKQIQKNWGYEYLREYKKYYKNNLRGYNKIKYKVFFKETFLNLCIWWNNKIKINIDKIDLEKWF